jgi:broad specificity phosphatase PhoE
MKGDPLKPGFCRFYVVRHGQTEWNVANKLQGHQDSPLTQAGIEAAKARAKTLRDISFTEIFSSDLLRAKKTAEIIALEHNIIVKTSELLRECAFGHYEGMHLNQFLEQLREMIAKRETLSEKEWFAFKLDHDIESDEEVAQRLTQFLREVAMAYPNKTIGVVCHAGVLRASLIQFGYATERSLPHGGVHNMAYYVVDSDGIEFFIKDTEGIDLQSG